MSERIETFEVSEGVRVVANTRSGDIHVRVGDPGTVKVVIDGSGASGYDISHLGGVVSIESPRRGIFGSANLALTVPPESRLELACTSGDINVRGEVDELRASVASGDVRAESVQSLCRVNSASGDVTVSATGDAEINTASGTVRLGTVRRDLRVNSASGDVYVDEVGESVRVKSASGTARIEAMLGSEVRHKSMSGDLYLGIPPRRTVEVDFSSLSGGLRNRLKKGDGSPAERVLAISFNAVSGDLNLHSARVAG